MKPSLTVAAVTAAALFSTAPHAQQAQSPLGAYVGAEVGTAQLTDSVPTPISPWVMDKSTTAWSVFAGIRPRKFLGLELGYIDFGNAKATNIQWDSLAQGSDVTYLASAKNHAWTGYVVGFLPIRRTGWDLFAKAGYASLTSKTYSNGNYPNVCTSPGCVPVGMASQSSSHQQGDFAYGFGAQYRFGALGVRAEYQRLTTSGVQPRHVALGLTWQF